LNLKLERTDEFVVFAASMIILEIEYPNRVIP